MKQQLLLRCSMVIISIFITGVSIGISRSLAFSDKKEDEVYISREEVVTNDDIEENCESVLEDVITDTELIEIPVEEEIVEVEQEDMVSNVMSMDLSADDAYLLVKIAMAEAGCEDIEGKALVIRVVLNRVRSDKFPDTIEEVIYQKNQFSPVSGKRWNSIEPNEECWEALHMVEVEGWDESEGALYFESKSKSTWHKDNLQFLFQHGRHFFYTEKECV